MMVGKWQPQWQVDLDQVFAMLQAAGADSLVYARAIRQPIEVAIDINNTFDSLTYSKGAAVLGMFESWMGRETFRMGVHNFLRRHSWGNVRADDFRRILRTRAA
jgi:alanyl aminopeptidase